MEMATKTARTLEIDGMTGDTCVQKVTGALKDVENVTTKSVKVGSAAIDADQVGCAAACSAIGKAGHPARESGASTKAQPMTEHKPHVAAPHNSAPHTTVANAGASPAVAPATRPAVVGS
ncbi:MAG: heavy-metal-associated domain-containing protein [Phycisphaerales bacterium]